MKNRFSLQIITNTAYAVLILFITAVLVFTFCHEKLSIMEERPSAPYQCITEYTKTLLKDSSFPVGVCKEYTMTLPEIAEGNYCFAMYLVHHYADIYIDGKQIYQLQPDPKNLWSDNIGSDFVFVPLYPSDSGKVMKIDLIPVNKAVIPREFVFQIGEKNDIIERQLQKDIPLLSLSILLMLASVVYMGIFLCQLWERNFDAKILYLFLVSFSIGLLKFSDTRFSPLIFGMHTIFMSYLSIVLLAVSFLPLLRLLQIHFHEKNDRLTNVCVFLAIVTSFLSILLPVFGIRNFYEILYVLHAALLVCAACMVRLILMCFKSKKLSQKNKIAITLYVLCGIGAVSDLGSYYLIGTSAGAVYTIFAFFVYIIVSGIMIIRGYFNQEKLLKLQQKELQENRIEMMFRQMQPQFIYGVLETIYQLCDIDPKRAASAIRDFSEYLRANFDSLKRKDVVPFEAEFKHVKTYLHIEQMLYEDGLNVFYDIKEKNFRLPALTIQPVVEHAIEHSVAVRSGGETNLWIMTEKTAKGYIVEVRYDGYDLETPPELPVADCSQIDINNIQSRLHYMTGGTITMERLAGKGTVVTIFIPCDEPDFYN